MTRRRADFPRLASAQRALNLYAHHHLVFNPFVAMQHTPWTKGSLPSDRIKPRYNNKQQVGGRGSPKGKEPAGPPKSRAVRKLEKQIEALRSASGVKDPLGGCYCMGMFLQPIISTRV